MFCPQIFQGNYDQYIIARHKLAKHITARYFRVHPVTWYSWISMRVEFYGCIVGRYKSVSLEIQQNLNLTKSQGTREIGWLY